MKKLEKAAKYNLLMFVLIFIYVFIIGLIPDNNHRTEIYSIVFAIIYAVAAKIISHKGKNLYFVYAGITIITMWMSEIFNFHLLGITSAVISIIFLILIISLMVIKIAQSKKVGLVDFIEAINIYFLMGIIGSILFRIVYNFLPGDSFNIPGETLQPTVDFIYFSFVTLSTTGYGDITPIEPFAKSLSIFLSICGQLYLTMIIAVLVGKYLSSRQK